MKKIVRKNYSDNSDLQRVIDSHNLLVENIMLSGYPIIDDESDSESSYDDNDDNNDDEEEQKLRQQFNKMFDKNGNKKEPNESQEDNNDDENNTQGINFDGMFDENSLIGGLAKELSSEIDPKDLGDIKSFADIGKLFAPGENGENKLQNVMKTVTQKLDAKMQNGQLNQEQLLNEAQNMMGSMGSLFGQGGQGGGNPMDMMSSMMGMMGQNMGSQGGQRRRHKRRGDKHRRR